MERIKYVLRQGEFHLLFFCACIMLFTWPLVTFSGVERLKRMFVYLFVCWGLVILVQFLVSRTLGADPERPKEEQDTTGD